MTQYNLYVKTAVLMADAYKEVNGLISRARKNYYGRYLVARGSDRSVRLQVTYT